MNRNDETQTHTPGPWDYRGLAGDHDFGVFQDVASSNGRDLALVRDFHEGNARNGSYGMPITDEHHPFCEDYRKARNLFNRITGA